MLRNKFLLTIIILVIIIYTTSGQGVSVNSSGALPDNSAMIDISSTDKGMLIPRIALTDTSDAVTINSPAHSLLIYNTTSGGGLSEGYYYNEGTSGSPHWVALITNPLSQNLNLGGNKLINVGKCTNDHDAANKAYVDSVLAAGGSSGYYVGQTFGAGGVDGVVFYIWDNGQHCLVASPINNNGGASRSYSINTAEVPLYNGYNAQSLYDGFHNTASINNQSTNSAANVCISYTTPGTSSGTWYLPAKFELDLIYRSQYIISTTYPSQPFTMNYYWSSTEYVNQTFSGHVQFFSDGTQVYNHGKNNNCYIRCIRAL